MYIRTICGNIEPEKLGKTLIHEHVFLNSALNYIGKDRLMAGENDDYNQPLTLKNLGKVRRDRSAIRDNLIFDDVDLMAREVGYFRNAGGQTIVDLTSVGLGRSPLDLKRISIKSGVNIVASTGFYVPEALSSEIKLRRVAMLADQMITEIMDGIADTGIKAGIIGEIGAPGDFSLIEKKVLEATAIVQKKTGAAISLHTACPNQLAISPRNLSWKERVMEVLDFLEKHDADLTRVIVGHADVVTGFKLEEHRSILERGVYIEYDNFQQEYPRDQYNTYSPTDWERIQKIITLVEEGYIKQLLICSDVWLKIMLKEYGGWGYAHVLENICPMLRANGLSEEYLNYLLIGNPRRILEF